MPLRPVSGPYDCVDVVKNQLDTHVYDGVGEQLRTREVWGGGGGGGGGGREGG